MYLEKKNSIFKAKITGLLIFCMCCFLMGCIGIWKKTDTPKTLQKPLQQGLFYGRIDKIYNSNGDINVDSIRVRVYYPVPDQDEIQNFKCVRKNAENVYWYFQDNWFDEDKYHGYENRKILNQGKYYEFHFKNHDNSSLKIEDTPQQGSIIVIHWELSL